MSRSNVLDGKVVVVTGAGGGVGEGIARLAARYGAKVLVNDLGGGPNGEGDDPGPAQAVAASIREAGGEAVENSVQIFPDSGGKQRPIVSTLVHAIIRLFGRSFWGVAHGLDCRDPAPSFGKQGEHQFDRA